MPTTLTKIFCILVLMCSSIQAQESYPTVTLKFAEKALKMEMASGETMVLPEFEIFNEKGLRIYHVTGFDESFRSEVEKILLKPMPQTYSIDETLMNLRTMDGDVVERSVFEGAQFVFVEYWAEWCPSCFQQMSAVQGILESHPDLDVTWVKVEKDPAKIKSMTVRMIKNQ